MIDLASNVFINKKRIANKENENHLSQIPLHHLLKNLYILLFTCLTFPTHLWVTQLSLGVSISLNVFMLSASVFDALNAVWNFHIQFVFWRFSLRHKDVFLHYLSTFSLNIFSVPFSASSHSEIPNTHLLDHLILFNLSLKFCSFLFPNFFSYLQIE